MPKYQMTSEEIRKKFLEFFENKGHKIIPSSSLVPDNLSVLLTTAGMQQFKKYYTGELDAVVDFGTKNTASIQKCFRTSDIDEVGDKSHLTFFEMLGNFSFGGYWKDMAIELAWEFLTQEIGISPDRMHVTIHESVALGLDEESYKIWHKKIGLPKNKIKIGGIDDNFWGPTGSEGPCGPTTEIYIDNVEVWNIVFNEFFSKTSREEAYKNGWQLKDLDIKGVDTGMGLERLVMVSQGVSTIFETDLFSSFIKIIPDGVPDRVRRLVADHMRGAAFLLSDGVRPSNKEAGYVLRRLIRRVIVYADQIGIDLSEILHVITEKYKIFYPELNERVIQEEFSKEREKFEKTLKIGFREFKKMEKIDATAAFKLYETYGLPFEILKDFGGKRVDHLKREDFDKEFKKHQGISRSGAEKKFGGHGLLLDTGELKAASKEEMKKVIRFHTATHLLQWALREILGKDVKQMGSDINPERMRFDFSFARKMTNEEIKKTEDLVNQKIQENLPVHFKEILKSEAEKIGALNFFKAKYPERVKVYFIGSWEESLSKEFCGGPHLNWTSEIGKFKIIKEEASSAGIRRIRAKVE